MSVKLKRILKKNEHVDHKNNNKTDDRLSNLQILTPLENNRKSAKGKIYFELTCDGCGLIFKREKRQMYSVRKTQYCSRSCYRINYASISKKLGLIKETVVRHGTVNVYSYHRCRCNKCKEAHRLKCQAYRERKYAEAK